MIVSIVFGKIISIFIIMLVGVLCFKMGIIDDYTKGKLSRLSTMVINPLLIFTSFQTDYDASLLKNMGILFVLAVLSFIISIVLGHLILREKPGYDLAVEKFAMVYNNCGFIGLPLGYAVFGSVGVIYATVFVATFHLFCWTHGIMLLDRSGFQLKKLINPSLMAVAAGILCFILQLRLPENIGYALDSISDMNTPLAMLLSGAIMAQLDFKKVLKKGRLLVVVLLRLVISPVVFGLLLRFLPLNQELRTVAIMMAACPTGALTITLAILYQRDDHYATELFTITTLLSVVTIPLCLLIAG